MKHKVAVIGHFGFGKNLLNGQTIKTKIVTKELENAFGAESVAKIDTHGGLKALLKLPFQIFIALKNAQNIVIFPAHKGVRIITPLLLFENFFFRRSVHYIVIGGWLPVFLKKKHLLRFLLRKFNGIYVETNTMKNALVEMGYSNVHVMPNCKELTVLTEDELVYAREEPFRLCTFSRVMKEKGIEDAIEAVKAVNNQFGRTVYSLDIYGQVDQNQKEWFDDLQRKFPSFVRYGGVVPYDRSVEVLKKYFALLFPTRFYTEGVPGTIIDAYAAGVPVIASKWESFEDIIDDFETGVGYAFNHCEDLTSLLIDFTNKPDVICSMKKKCVKKAKIYAPENSMKILFQNFRL